MKFYFRISVILSFVLSIACFVAMRGPFPMASDGSGPSGEALIAYLLFIVAGVLLAHTFILAVFVYAANVVETRIGLGVLLAGALLVSLPEIESFAKDTMSDRARNADPNTKTLNAIRSDTPAKFLKKFNAIPASKITPEYMNDLNSALVFNGRIDILEQLETQGFAVVEAGKEGEWARLVYSATFSEELSPQQRLKLYEWLFSRAAPFKFSLEQYENDILSLRNFLIAFDRVENPASQKMFDLLVQHGARFRDGNPELIVWYCARYGHFETLKFLLAQGANPNHIDSSENATALDVAIASNNKSVIQALLKAGAKKSADLTHQ